MRITFKAPFDADRHIEVRPPPGYRLGTLLAQSVDAVVACLINGVFVPLPTWQEYSPRDTDRITFFLKTGEPVSTAAAATAAVSLWTKIGTAAVVAAISAALSLGLSYLIRALTPTPSNQAGKTEEVFGLAGLTNTTALGTPKFLVYGTRRVFGHIIATRVEISTDGKTTNFAALYFMGEGPIDSITDIEIDDTPVAQFEGATTETRPGDGVNTPAITGFRTVSQVFSDARALSATPIVYTTRSTAVESITLIFSTPFLFKIDSKGVHLPATHVIKVEYSLVSPVSYVEATGSPINWTEDTESPRFRTLQIVPPSSGQYLVRVTLNSTTNQSAAAPSLFNVQEEASGNLLYVHSALLAVRGVASAQIQTFESMRVSAVVKGRKVKIWNGASVSTAWTANRAWIVRDMLTNSRVGLGHRIAESMFDDDAALTVANYWDELVQGITRDECNLIVNDRRAAWDWIKAVLAEGRAALIPSGGKFKLVVDQANTPNLLYSMPGNIIEGSMLQRFGSGEGTLPNTIRGQFPDKNANYQLQVLEIIAPGAEAEPTREELVTILTLTDLPRVFWLLRYQILKMRLMQRSFSWQSPSTAMVSEPFDHVSLSYETQDAARGISGFLAAGSTTTRLLLDRPVTLGATTYDLIVRHQADNSVERKVVATGAGTWGAIAPTVALTTTPAEGDLYALGVQTTAIMPVVMTDVRLNDDGTYQLAAVEYQATIHDTPVAPELLTAWPARRLLPLPLWNATIASELTEQSDGAWQITLIFEVTPGLSSYGGPVVSATSTTVVLGSIFPTIDDYFNNATLAIVEGTGTGQRRNVDDYAGSTRTCTVTAWTTIPDATSLFAITWGEYDDFGGFTLEARQGADPYSAYAASPTFSTTRLTRVAEGSGYTLDIRFTPVGKLGQVNTQGRWVVSVTITGDSTAPAAPTEEEP